MHPSTSGSGEAIVRPRESSWLFVRVSFVDCLGALRERNTGSYYAKRVSWRELCERAREGEREEKRGCVKRKNKEKGRGVYG